MNRKERYHAAIVLAAGSGTRMGAGQPKQFLDLEGKPLVWYSLSCFQESEQIHAVVLVTSEDAVDYCRKEIVEKYGLTKVKAVTAGGKERCDSVYAGLKALDILEEAVDYVLIHDSARPFVEDAILSRSIEAAQETGACTVAVPSKDTVCLSDAVNSITSVPDRRNVWIVQTPQVFSFSLILRAHEALRQREGGLDGITDDAMVVRRAFGTEVKLALGSYRNIKVTTPEDLAVARGFLREQ